MSIANGVIPNTKSDLRFSSTNGIHCPSCDKMKMPYEFNHKSSSATGRQPWCRRCQSAHNKLHRAKDRTDKKVIRKMRKKPTEVQIPGALVETPHRIPFYRRFTTLEITLGLLSIGALGLYFFR